MTDVVDPDRVEDAAISGISTSRRVETRRSLAELCQPIRFRVVFNPQIFFLLIIYLFCLLLSFLLAVIARLVSKNSPQILVCGAIKEDRN